MTSLAPNTMWMGDVLVVRVNVGTFGAYLVSYAIMR